MRVKSICPEHRVSFEAPILFLQEQIKDIIIFRESRVQQGTRSRTTCERATNVPMTLKHTPEDISRGQCFEIRTRTDKR